LQHFKKPETFDKVLKTLLDYPTFDLKAKLLEALSQHPEHALQFTLTLNTLLPKLL
jgi:hypothetical protein